MHKHLGIGTLLLLLMATAVVSTRTLTGISITTETGSIGGWDIDADQLDSGSGSTFVGLNSDSGSDVAIWAGGSTATSAPFQVLRTGGVFAEAFIGGQVDTEFFSATDELRHYGMTGSGDAYACVTSAGVFFRSSDPCN
jgi:hypothetical protein